MPVERLLDGQEGQVDWYEAWVDFEGERTKVQVFAMRSMASGAAFHRAYLSPKFLLQNDLNMADRLV